MKYKRLRRRLTFITDIGMLLYWGVTALMFFKVLNIPGEWLFKNYYEPHNMAWNWSFAPLDILLSLAGLKALRLEGKNNESWKIWATISLSLTVCAGLMAISYWVLVRDFDIAWWVPNLFLMLWPLPFLYQLGNKAGS